MSNRLGTPVLEARIKPDPDGPHHASTSSASTSTDHPRTDVDRLPSPPLPEAHQHTILDSTANQVDASQQIDLIAHMLRTLPDAQSRLQALAFAQVPPDTLAAAPGVVDHVRMGFLPSQAYRDPFTALPPEVGLRILEFVDHPRTLTRASQVSRTWRRFATTPAVWRTLARRFGFRLAELQVPRRTRLQPHDASLEWLGLSHHANHRNAASSSPPAEAAMHASREDQPDGLTNWFANGAPASGTGSGSGSGSRMRRRRFYQESEDDDLSVRPRKRARRLEPDVSTPIYNLLDQKIDTATMADRAVQNTIHSLQSRFLLTGVSLDSSQKAITTLTRELSYLDRALHTRLRPSSGSQIGMSLLDSLEGIVRNESARRRNNPTFATLRVFPSPSVRGVVVEASTRAKLLESLLFYGDLGPTSTNMLDTQSFCSTFPHAPRDESNVPVPEVRGGATEAGAPVPAITSHRSESPSRAVTSRRHIEGYGCVVMEKSVYDGAQPSVSCLDSKGIMLDMLKPSPEGALPSSLGSPPGTEDDGVESGVSHAQEAFRLQYLVTRGWLDKGGRLLSQHYLYPDVMITEMVADDDRIVLGMGNNAIHILDARTGLLQETLHEHSSGVWCLALVPSWPGLRPRGYAEQEPREAKPTHNMVLTEYDSRPEAYLKPSRRSVLDPLEWHTAPWLKHLPVHERELLQVYRRIEQKLLDHPTWTSKQPTSSTSTSLTTTTTRTPPPITGTVPDQNTFSTHPGPGRGKGKDKVAGKPVPLSSNLNPVWTPDPQYVDVVDPSREQQIPAVLRTAWTGADILIGAARDTEQAACTAARNTQGLPNAPPITPESQVEPLACVRANQAMILEQSLIDKPLLVSGGCDRTVIVWDLTKGKRIHVLRGHTATVRCVSLLTVRGRIMAVTGSRDNEARLWDLRTGLLIHTFKGHQNSIRCMAVSEECEVTSSGPTVRFHPGELRPKPTFATGSYDSSVRVWDAETGQCLHTLQGHSQQVYSIAFRRGTIITGSLDTTVRVWDAVNGRALGVLKGHTSLVSVITIRGNMVVTGGSDGRVLVYDLDKFSCIHRLCAHDNSVTSLQFVPGLAHGLVPQYYLERRRASQRPRYERGTAGAGLNPPKLGSVDETFWSYNPESDDARWLVSASNDGTAKLWDLADGVCVRYLGPASKHVLKFVCTNDRAVLASFPILKPAPRTDRSRLDILSFRPLSSKAERWLVVQSGQAQPPYGSDGQPTTDYDGYVHPRPVARTVVVPDDVLRPHPTTFQQPALGQTEEEDQD